jgi:hypothetical protein
MLKVGPQFIEVGKPAQFHGKFPEYRKNLRAWKDWLMYIVLYDQ